MALCSASSMLLLMLLLFSSMSIAASTEVGDDEAALLAFKAAAVGGGGGLASWTRNVSGNSGYGLFCGWEGVTCRGRRVVALSLPSGGLAGVLSPAIGNFSYLRALNLSWNTLGAGIPARLGRLRRLHVLDLSHNAFSGELPANLSSGLTIMALRFNRFRGHVPSEIGDRLAHLRVLDLRGNSLTGAMPASLANLSSLRVLDLGFNQLDGEIPPGLGGLRKLRYLTLGKNSLSGEPPLSLYNLSSLERFQLLGNMLRGGIPADIGDRFPGMQVLGFSENNFTGSIPASLSNLTTLQVLDLSRNVFSGHVPRTLASLRALEKIHLGYNRLEADDKEGWQFITSMSNCSQLQILLLKNNNAFTGEMPISVVNLSTTLQGLSFDATGISGSIPSAISNLVSLQFLGLGDTFISGAIPESIGELANLGMLGLFNTDLSGLIPPSIGNLSKLTNLDAYNNKLQGPIPVSIGKLNSLLGLDLSMNRLNGSIPRDVFKLPVISIYLNLSYNSLSGPLTPEVGSLSKLNRLVLSGNQLSGYIPESIGECTMLQQLWLDDNSLEGSMPQSINSIKGLSVLNLSLNKLSGVIPDAISIHNLQQLYLAHNNFSGRIPTVLQNLKSLSELDVSFNNRQGEVPNEGIFRILANLSITGNTELCGGIPQLHLAPCRTNPITGRLKSLTIALVTLGALLFSAFVVAVIQLVRRKLIQKKNRPLLSPIIEEKHERVSYHALENGTNGFSETNCLGKGSFGAVYKCTFQDDGIIAAVKVFNLEQSGSSRSFVAECEALRRVRHRCLIKIITCCSSINHHGQEFKALVFEFMPNGTLNDWLHPKSGIFTMRNTSSIEQRLDIAINVVDALDYLHNHCQPPIVHCDLKPSNILLAEDMSARVGDFGISRILPESASKTIQNSNSATGIRGSIGYVAPEYGEGSSASTLGDVYSLGILLLEIFTGRCPTNDMFRGSLDLHNFSEDAIPEKIWEIADTIMWLHIDASDSSRKRRIENCLLSVSAIGISCSKKQPRERKPIQDVAIHMRAIRDSYIMLA